MQYRTIDFRSRVVSILRANSFPSNGFDAGQLYFILIFATLEICFKQFKITLLHCSGTYIKNIEVNNIFFTDYQALVNIYSCKKIYTSHLII